LFALDSSSSSKKLCSGLTFEACVFWQTKLTRKKERKKEREREAVRWPNRVMKKTQNKITQQLSNGSTALLLLLLLSLLPTVNSWVCYLPGNWLPHISQGKVMQNKELAWSFK
jgi:hypothetical protein